MGREPVTLELVYSDELLEVRSYGATDVGRRREHNEDAYLRDEGSSLGTYLNGQRIASKAPVTLKHGDVIQIGYFQVFEFRVQ